MNIGTNTNKSKAHGKYFGTDGFRGEPNITLTPLHAYKIGRFLGWHYSKIAESPRLLVGKDTRRSGYMLEYAIAAGITASGADAYLMHVTTTPSISYVCREEGFSCGIMITASHNPYFDNGIKILAGNGEKLDESTTSLIESYLDGDVEALSLTGEQDVPFALRDDIGAIFDYSAGREKYIEHLIDSVPHTLNNLKIGLDCANGASWMIAEKVFDALGARIFTIGNKPDGTNINEDCGSTHITALQDLVLKNKLDVGFAFDGDADRCIAVDSDGNVVDGDKIIFILANRFKRLGILEKNGVAITVMSNLGLVEALRSEGIGTSITPVGDKYVYQRMKEEALQLGGEQSGHIIMSPYSVTGDGILTALMVADEIIAANSTLSSLCKDVTLYPQITVNLKVRNKNEASTDITVTRKVSDCNQELYPRGRVIFRASGTEDLIRVTVEATELSICENYIEQIKKLLEERGHLL